MQATPKIRARIKKLLTLATAPANADEATRNEAHSARTEADRLMYKYGLKAADFEDDALEIIDDQCDDNRLRLARAVGASRRVVTLASKAGQVAYRGRPPAAKSARELYVLLMTTVSRSCEIGPRDPGRVVWRLCYWAGFVDAVCDRLLNNEVQSWFRKTMTQAQRKQSPKTFVHVGSEQFSQQFVPTPAVEEQRHAVAQFAGYFDPSDVRRAIEAVTREAYEGGRRLGTTVGITEYDREEVVAADRMLAAMDDGEEM